VLRECVYRPAAYQLVYTLQYYNSLEVHSPAKFHSTIQTETPVYSEMYTSKPLASILGGNDVSLRENRHSLSDSAKIIIFAAYNYLFHRQTSELLMEVLKINYSCYIFQHLSKLYTDR
jgi:hypothetical protein